MLPLKKDKGFTLIELLVVISIIGLLASIIVTSLWGARTKAYYARSQEELSQLSKALELYFMDHNYEYPADVNRGLPNGLEAYLSSRPSWPAAPWPGSVYDWDYWDSDASNPNAGTLSEPPAGKVYQISIRFCPFESPSGCAFPKQSWASDFDYYSSAYWCVEGPCRAHGSQPMDHPGCCLGGACPPTARQCR